MINLEHLEIIELLDEHCIVKFTGKINILDKFDHRHLGILFLIDGHIIGSRYDGVVGVKSFYRLIIDHVKLRALKFIVEPEVVHEEERNIHYPYSTLKLKSQETLDRFEASMAQRPPSNVAIYIKPDFIQAEDELTEEEFLLMCTISDYNSISDIYSKCPLIDYEITTALVGLRKKGALLIKSQLQIE